MNRKISAIITATILVLAFVLFVNFEKNNPTGFVTYSDNVSIADNGSSITNENIKDITREVAVSLIDNAKSNIEIMNASYGLQITNVQDLLIEAEKALQIADYAEILRGNVNVSDSEKLTARSALSLVNWKDANYSDVYLFTKEIESRKNEAFLLKDKFTLKSSELSSIDKKILSNETLSLYNKAQESFYYERYNETDLYLEQFQISLEKDKERQSTLAGISDGTKNFVQRYWIGIIIFLAILIPILKISFKRIKINSLKKKIEKMKFENVALNDMMKKTQTERFKENKISELIYNIRMNKYQKRLEEIKQNLPVLEQNLKDLKK